jgi:hypothetical protein
MRSSIVAVFGLAVCGLGASLSGAVAAHTVTVRFDAGTYAISVDCQNAPATPCGSPTDGSLTVTIDPAMGNTPATANFVISTNETNAFNLVEYASFTLPEIADATGLEADNPGLYSPYFSGPDLTAADWNTAAYPVVVFWSEEDGGGVEIADSAALISPLIEQFAADDSGLPFTVISTPEPAAWAMTVTGLALAGGGLRRRRASAV